MSTLSEPPVRRTNPNSMFTSINITKKERAVILAATEAYNDFYCTDLTVKDFVREAIAEKVARLNDEIEEGKQ